MGQRERLLDAAKASLLTRGHAATTARDLATDAEVSLGAIGYHFGSKDTLLDLALYEVLEDWAAAVMGAVAGGSPADDVVAQLVGGWQAAVDGFENYAPLLAAFLDALLRGQRSEETRRRIADHIAVSRAHIRQALVTLLPGLDEGDAQVTASLALAVVDGLFVQWLADPEAVPDGATLVATVRRLLSLLPPVDRGSA